MSTLTRFQKYWLNLKVTNPDEYEQRLARNRERAKAHRRMISDDPERRAQHNAKRRESYRRKLLNAAKPNA